MGNSSPLDLWMLMIRTTFSFSASALAAPRSSPERRSCAINSKKRNRPCREKRSNCRAREKRA